MSPQPDLQKPRDDTYSLIGGNWPSESESAYRAAQTAADDAAAAATAQAQGATDAGSKIADEAGRLADAVSNGYSSAATQLSDQAIQYTTIGAWMTDAGGKVGKAKSRIRQLVHIGTQEIRDALNSELSGTPATPSSSELIAKYRADIASVASKLTTELDSIGHSLHGDSGSSRTPSYVSVSTAPTYEHADPHASMASYTGTPGAPEVEPHQLPPMPRATTSTTAENAEAPSAPTASAVASPHTVNPTLSNLVAGSASPSGTPSSTSTSSTKSPSDSSSGTPAGKAAQGSQPNETQQDSKTPALPRIPTLPLPDLPAAATDIVTAVSSATASQLPMAPSTPGSSQAPASTGVTPGVSGAAPLPSALPGGLAPIGGLPTPPSVVQAPPVAQASPASPTPGVQAPAPTQQAPAPAPRGPVADLGWIQKTYGLVPGVELPKSENSITPVLFIASLPESEAHLHRALASLRHQFEAAEWGQPMAVGLIKRGLETRLVYVTADGLSIHPSGVLLPAGVTPLDEMPNAPTAPELSGSLMVSEKLTSLIPRNWEIEQVLSTVPGEENRQSTEQYQELVEAGELLNCSVSRGRDDVTDDEALSLFARAAIGSAGCGELDAESARLRAARWVGVQPAGYHDVLSRWYLADAAESMSAGRWGEAVWASEKYMSVSQSRSQAA